MLAMALTCSTPLPGGCRGRLLTSKGVQLPTQQGNAAAAAAELNNKNYANALLLGPGSKEKS